MKVEMKVEMYRRVNRVIGFVIVILFVIQALTPMNVQASFNLPEPTDAAYYGTTTYHTGSSDLVFVNNYKTFSSSSLSIYASPIPDITPTMGTPEDHYTFLG